MNLYEVKVKFKVEVEGRNGSVRQKNSYARYLVEDTGVSEAEANITERYGKDFADFEVEAVRQTKYDNVHLANEL